MALDRLMVFWVQEILLYPIPHCTSKMCRKSHISHAAFTSSIRISCRSKCIFYCSGIAITCSSLVKMTLQNSLIVMHVLFT